MIINKELALIAEKKGFRESDNFTRYYSSLKGDNELYLKQGKRIINLAQWVIAPESETLLDWIFDNYIRRPFIGKVEWLEFWYNTLIEHKFTLMGEFISRLEEWFGSNNLHFCSRPNSNGKNWFTEIVPLNTNDYSFIEGLNSSKEAKHEAILQCFKLLKEEYVA